MKALIAATGNPQTLGLELIGMGAGLFWTITYILIILRSRKDDAYGMPFAALCANVAWEFLETFIIKVPGSGFEYWITMIINISWFALDVVIMLQFLKNFSIDWPKHIPGYSHYIGMAFGLLMCICIMHGLHVYFLSYQTNVFDTQFGMVLSSFAQNLMMSILFVAMLVRRNGTIGQSPAIALCKGLGTLMASIYWYMLGATQELWVALYFFIFLFDAYYLLLLLRLQKLAMMQSAGAPA